MLVTKKFGLPLRQTLKTVVELASLAALVLPLDVERKEGTDEEDQRSGSDVDCVSRYVAMRYRF